MKPPNARTSKLTYNKCMPDEGHTLNQPVKERAECQEGSYNERNNVGRMREVIRSKMNETNITVDIKANKTSTESGVKH